MRQSRVICHQQGYTLLEMSITIVIISLGVLAIMGGTSLIKHAELRGVIAEISSLKSAIHSFDLRHGNLPGDMSNATIALSATTQNGNGDRRITYNTTAGQNNEALRAWQHLALAQMLLGSFSGSDAGQEARVGVNSPPSKIEEGLGGYSLDNDGWHGNAAVNLLILGAPHSSNMLDSAILSANDARTIDAKMDDSSPASGTVWAQEGFGGTNCVNTTPNPPEYFASDSDILHCQLGVAIE